MRDMSFLMHFFCCPKALFQPSLLGLECVDIHEMAYNSIMKCDVGLWKDLYSNIILARELSMFEGISDRMQKKLVNLALSMKKIKIIINEE